MGSRYWLKILPIVAGASACAADLTFTGYARATDSHQLLYLETHFVRDADTPAEQRIVVYRCAASAMPFARKELSYAETRTVPSFDFRDARSGFAEGLSRDAGHLVVSSRAGANAVRGVAELPAASGMVADAGFDEFVRSNWAALERGDALVAPFVVPSLLDSVKFRIRKRGESEIGGEPASEIRLSVAGVFGWFVSDIDVSYRKRDRRLMRYRGLTNIRDAAGDLLDAEIDFPDAERRSGAPDFSALRAEPLVTRCE